jgi:tetratricopeptide (TPR) repeat protein
VTNAYNAAFHRQVAEALAARYQDDEHAPTGWRETQTWHWEQAGAFHEATGSALDVAEQRVTRMDFVGARRWAEQALTLLERLPLGEQQHYELRAHALALAVLEFGGQFREGLEFARRMLRAAQRGGNLEAQARALTAMGRMQRELGQLAPAESSLHEARALAERDERGELEAEVRLHLAKVHQLQGRHLEALQELQLAREGQEQTDDKLRLAHTLTGIGDVYRVLGSSREALTFYTRALSMEQGRGSLLGQAILKDKLALALMDQGKLLDALASAEESLRLRERLNDVVGQARSHSVLGTIQRRLGRHEESLGSFERARDLEELTQNPRGQGIALLHLGDAARSLRRQKQAMEHYARALALARRGSDQIGVARALERLGDLLHELGQREAAAARWSEALNIRDSLRHADEATELRRRLGAIGRGA